MQWQLFRSVKGSAASGWHGSLFPRDKNEIQFGIICVLRLDREGWGRVRVDMDSGWLITDNLTSFSFMSSTLRFIWNATRGHRLTPWRSPYLLWRIETYCGVKMQHIGFLGFWEFLWRERLNLWRFLKWTHEMKRYLHPRRELREERTQLPAASASSSST